MAAKTSLLKSGFITGFLDPKIKTFSTLFPKTTFFFRDSRLSKLVIDRDLKNNRNKMLLSWFKLRHKNKNKFHFISIYHAVTSLFPGLESCWANFKRLFQELTTLREPWKWSCIFSTSVHLFLFDEMSNICEFPWSWFLGIVLRKKIVVAYLFPP